MPPTKVIQYPPLRPVEQVDGALQRYAHRLFHLRERLARLASLKVVREVPRALRLVCAGLLHVLVGDGLNCEPKLRGDEILEVGLPLGAQPGKELLATVLEVNEQVRLDVVSAGRAVRGGLHPDLSEPVGAIGRTKDAERVPVVQPARRPSGLYRELLQTL